MKFQKLFTLFVLLHSIVFIHSFAQNQSSIDSLINSYTYNFSTEAIYVDSFQDSVIDSNLNSISDLLNISIQTSKANSSYVGILTLYDKIPQIRYSYLDSNETNFLFNTTNLHNNQFNYTLEIRDFDFSLLYRSDYIQTSEYLNLERGVQVTTTNISKINDELYVNIKFENISSFDIETKEVTIELEYNNKSYFVVSNISLINTQDIIHSFRIPEYTIKRSHINGNFKIKNIYINEKKFEFDYSSQLLNFEDLVDSPYIKSAQSIIHYENPSINETIEYLELELEIINQNYSTNQNFNISLQLVDSFNNKLKDFENLELNTQLNQEVNIISVIIPNDILYFHKIDSNIIASYILLKNNENNVIDYLEEINISENLNFLNVKRPDLSDLVILLDPKFDENTKSTNLTILVENLGNLNAFNLEIEIYSNKETKKLLIPFIENKSFKSYSLNYENSTDGELYTAFIDLRNIIDEENETNNVHQEFSIGPNSIQFETSFEVLPLTNLTSLIEIQLQNSGKIPFYNSIFNFENYSYNLFLNENSSKILYLEINNQNLKESFDASFSSKYITKNISFSNSNSSILITDNKLNSNLIEFNFFNNLSSNQNIIFLNKTFSINPNESSYYYKQFIDIANIPTYINYTQNNKLKKYILTSNESENDSQNITIINLGIAQNNTYIYEIILDNLISSTQTLFNFEFDSVSYTYIIDSNSIKYVYVESQYSNLTNQQNQNFDGIIILNSTLSNSNSSIYEIILENAFSSNKVINFNLGVYSYVFNLLKHERKVLFVEKQENNLTIQNISVE